MAIEKLSVILELVTGNYKKEAKDAADATGKIGNSARSVTGSLGAMIGPAAIGGAVIGLGKMALAAGENADRLFDLQAQTGLSTDVLQEWEFVAKAAGAGTEVFSDAVKAVIRNLDGTEGATGAAGKAYETLGISVFDASGKMKDAGTITDEVFEKLSGMTNITERNALAQDLFGKKWEETISVLDLGSEALGNLREEGQKGVVSAESLRNADKFRETWQKFLAQVGPKLNEALGKIAPALTTVAEAAIDAFDAMEPLIDVLGFVADKFSDANIAVEEGRDSPSKWAQGWAIASDIGQGAIFGMVGVLGALFDKENVLRDNTRDVTQEIHDSWANLGATFTPIIGNTIAMLDNQNRSHRNVAAAADTQRRAMINLANAQADLLDPLSNVLRLEQESIEANKRLADAQASTTTTVSEMTLAIIEAQQAQLRLAAAGADLSADPIQAYAQILITQFGYSEKQALDTLEALNLLDGWTGEASFTLNMAVKNLEDAIKATGGSGINNTDIQIRQHGGPIRRGMPYLVGEAGPELIVPSQSGMVIPNSRAAAAARGYTGALQAQRDLTREMADPLNQPQAAANVADTDGLDRLRQYAIQAGINMEAFDRWRLSVDLLAGSMSNLPSSVGGVNTITGNPNRPGAFDTGGVVTGRRIGDPVLAVLHVGETVLPTHKPMSSWGLPSFDSGGMVISNGQLGGMGGMSAVVGSSRSVTINVARPMDNFRQDLQHATILASLTNLVEGF